MFWQEFIQIWLLYFWWTLTYFTYYISSELLVFHNDLKFIIIHFLEEGKLNSDDLTYIYFPQNLFEPEACQTIVYLSLMVRYLTSKSTLRFTETERQSHCQLHNILLFREKDPTSLSKQINCGTSETWLHRCACGHTYADDHTLGASGSGITS